MYAVLFHSEAAAPARANLAAIILRLSLALTFLFHGLDKIVHGFGGTAWVNEMYAKQPGNPSQKPDDQRKQLEEMPTSLRFMGTQLAVAWGEFLGGLALLVGMLARVAALGLILIQIGAVILVTAPHGFNLSSGGYEYNLALIAMCLALIVLGAGRWSVDWALARRRLQSVPAAASSASLPVAGPHRSISEPAEQVAPGATS
jgi:putative oxidoreductase